MNNQKENIFLFSIDLEDIRLRIDNGLKYSARVEALVEEYLSFLNTYQSQATFFTVGDIPKYYPDLIAKIVAEGHEIACHSNKHLPVTKQTSKEFKEDLLLNMENLYNSGAKELLGYRAPTFSITENTPWAYEVLDDLGFTYSSSILPAKNPLYGWDGFGQSPKKIRDNLWEIPICIRKGSFFKVPFAGGVYFRFLPFYDIRKSFKNHFRKKIAVSGYFHPYDIDVKQEKFMHPEINSNWIYNQLLYFNRKNTFKRLHSIMEIFEPKIIPYKNYRDYLNNNHSKTTRNVEIPGG